MAKLNNNIIDGSGQERCMTYCYARGKSKRQRWIQAFR